MELIDFYIGKNFRLGEKQYRCTDIGSRVIIAVWLNPSQDPSWFHGPPFAVPEIVLDEFDLVVCFELDGEDHCG